MHESLADTIDVDQLQKWRAEHPGAVIVAYVNTSAAVKAESDICYTSSNVVEVSQSLPAETPVLFLPDQFLGAPVRRQTGRTNMSVWLGDCHMHAGISPEDVRKQVKQHPYADLLVHPECGCASSVVWVVRHRGPAPRPDQDLVHGRDGRGGPDGDGHHGAGCH